MPNSTHTPVDHLLRPVYPVLLADGKVMHKRLEELTAAELDALIDAEKTAAAEELRHADALQAYMDNKTWIGSGDS